MSSFPFVSDLQNGIPKSAISTGLPNIDEMLCVGGLPRGSIVELYGPPDCGKSTIALNWISAAQAQHLTAVYVDAEQKFDAAWAQACGVNLRDLVLISSPTGNQAAAAVESLMRTFTVDLIVFDSIAALTSEEELEISLEDNPAEIRMEFLTRMLRRLSGLAHRGRCCLLAVNQIRIVDRGEAMEVSTGGRALGIYSSIRIRLSSALRLTGGNLQVGMMTVKNKLGEPFLEAGVEIRGAQLRSVERKTPQVSPGMGKAARNGFGM